MQKKYFFIIALVLSVCLVSCDNQGAPSSPSRTIPSSQINSRSDNSALYPLESSTPLQDNFLNQSLINMLGEKNSEIEEQYSGIVYASISGKGTAVLEFYDPYIEFAFSATENPQENAWLGDSAPGIFSTNPFVDTLIVEEISLQDNIDEITQIVPTQNSLQQLFQTKTQITYELLCEQLEQIPALSHEESTLYLPIGNVDNKVGNTIGRKIEGGLYSALYETQNAFLEVFFVKEEEQYVAFRVAIKPT